MKKLMTLVLGVCLMAPVAAVSSPQVTSVESIQHYAGENTLRRKFVCAAEVIRGRKCHSPHLSPRPRSRLRKARRDARRACERAHGSDCRVIGCR